MWLVMDAIADWRLQHDNKKGFGIQRLSQSPKLKAFNTALWIKKVKNSQNTTTQLGTRRLLYSFQNITCHWLNFWNEITKVKRSRWSAIFTWSEDTLGARIGILNRNNYYRGIEGMNGKPPSGESNLQPCTAHLSTASQSYGLFPGCSSPQVK